MALVIEDGTGIPGANSYVDVSETTEYLEAREKQAGWSAIQTSVSKEAKLVQAGDYLNGIVWAGIALTTDQRMSFPRDEWPYIPAQILEAQILLAVEAIDGPLTDEDKGPPVIKIKERLEGVGETETEYAPGTDFARSFPHVYSLIRPFLKVTTASSIQTARRILG